MHAMTEGIKVLQTLVLSERETNVQLTLELWKAEKEKGVGLNEEAAKAMKTQMLDPFMGKDTKAKRGKIVGPLSGGLFWILSDQHGRWLAKVDVATLALGSGPRQRLARVWAKREA
jgi:hypothetical protein